MVGYQVYSGRDIDYLFFSAYRSVVFQEIQQWCYTIYICIGAGVFGCGFDGVGWNGRPSRCVCRRTGIESPDTPRIALDESSGICWECSFYTLFPYRGGYDDRRAGDFGAWKCVACGSGHDWCGFAW